MYKMYSWMYFYVVSASLGHQKLMSLEQKKRGWWLSTRQKMKKKVSNDGEINVNSSFFSGSAFLVAKKYLSWDHLENPISSFFLGRNLFPRFFPNRHFWAKFFSIWHWNRIDYLETFSEFLKKFLSFCLLRKKYFSWLI